MAAPSFCIKRWWGNNIGGGGGGGCQDLEDFATLRYITFEGFPIPKNISV